MRKKYTVEKTKEKIIDGVMEHFLGSRIIGPDILPTANCLPYTVREINFTNLSRTQLPSVDVLLMVPEVLDRQRGLCGLIQTNRYRFALTRTCREIQKGNKNPEWRGGVNIKRSAKTVRRQFLDHYNQNAIWLLEKYGVRAKQVLMAELLTSETKNRFSEYFLFDEYSLLD